MRRRLFTFLVVLSLVGCAGACLLWIGSYVLPRVVMVSGPGRGITGLSGEQVPARRTLLLLSDRGHLGWGFELDVIGDDDSPWNVGTEAIWNAPRPFWAETGGLFFEVATDGPSDVVPYWLILVVLGAMPTAWYLRRRQERRGRDRSPMACASCGYDLRASPGRCAECGTARGVTE